jgi:hypothetical protein
MGPIFFPPAQASMALTAAGGKRIGARQRRCTSSSHATASMPTAPDSESPVTSPATGEGICPPT